MTISWSSSYNFFLKLSIIAHFTYKTACSQSKQHCSTTSSGLILIERMSSIVLALTVIIYMDFPKYTHVQWKRTTLQMRISVAYQKLCKSVYLHLLFRTNAMFSHQNFNSRDSFTTWHNVSLQIALIAIWA